MVDTFKITIHMVSSLDGYIASEDNSISWFETADRYEKGLTVTAEESAEFLKSIDCYIMGSRTYELALELSRSYGWPYGNVPTIVLTKRKLTVERDNVELYSGNLVKLVDERLKPVFKNVWVVGGAEVTTEFIRLNLAGEIRHSVLPILLGGGLSFYDRIGQQVPLHLKDVKAYKNGMVELHYDIKKEAVS